MMTSSQIRQKFLRFFEERGHTIIPSASLVPNEADPTVLFTTAGMHPLVPYFLGEKHPGGKRVVSSQKCVRTADISEVGDASHLTFFEMLGNWSFGDYFKKEAIEWSWEFLTDKQWLGLDKNRLAVSVFAGDADAPFDEEAFNLWKRFGVPEKKISKLPKKNNWWGPAGTSGPCGPDTEIFYWTGDPDKIPETFNDDNNLWVEIWNNVFMEYNKTDEGNFEPLKQKNVDTGMGLERIIMILQDKDNVYETDLFQPIVDKVKSQKSKVKIEEKSIRVIADHIKASVFIIADDVEPSNTGRGYVLRRLIRRAVRHGKLLGIGENFLAKVAGSVFEIYKESYPELKQSKEKILDEIKKEEERFTKTLNHGLKEFGKIAKNKIISGRDAFILFSTYGFPVEITQDMAKEKGIDVDIESFDKELKEHQELSKTASVGMFKGGLSSAGARTAKLHTATHLLHAALRKVLGDHVSQKGSNITEERLRFDFSHPEKLTEEQKRELEDLVNEKIKEDLSVICEEMELNEAKNSGAIGIFGSKYGDKVKVYSVGDFSKEICGGPHAKTTGELGRFKIVKEEAASAGVRRIKAILE
ncbi:MAG: Alanine-tRNA ligase [Parcubacteria group bacterium GW2011_GWC2_40_31]|nr:MAG: Alanine-tRNA ligase [Parcubacteria group bacterium GW2011_GWF2_40_10]KKR47712.1 MAG: Alanine-tRNA ligase [Parcubacteria group bacterium GW2011_GWA2_40_143]KKR60034.1 MAG: Alanine-tRNA ligase [Parcubacteria group bacterium GW2011_GWC2_40_31]KKR81416.1 MAG: Alanine-tRNA ligase [Parcubacteria group bacterium GW2011_GWD2_40_9]